MTELATIRLVPVQCAHNHCSEKCMSNKREARLRLSVPIHYMELKADAPSIISPDTPAFTIELKADAPSIISSDTPPFTTELKADAPSIISPDTPPSITINRVGQNHI